MQEVVAPSPIDSALDWVEAGAVDKELDRYGYALAGALRELEAYGPGYLFGLGELDALVGWHADHLDEAN